MFLTPVILKSSVIIAFNPIHKFCASNLIATSARLPLAVSGFGDNLQNATSINFSDSSYPNSATLPHKITNGEGDNLGNGTLYIYIDIPINKGLSSGVTYNATSSWQLFAS